MPVFKDGKPIPRVGKQYGSFTVSVSLAGSQKLTVMPILMNIGGGKEHIQRGKLDKSGVSSIPFIPGTTVMEAILIGNIQYQQISVIGFRGVPLQIASAVSEIYGSIANVNKNTINMAFCFAFLILIVNFYLLYLHE
jgi:hypothetical protein